MKKILTIFLITLTSLSCTTEVTELSADDELDDERTYCWIFNIKTVESYSYENGLSLGSHTERNSEKYCGLTEKVAEETRVNMEADYITEYTGLKFTVHGDENEGKKIMMHVVQTATKRIDKQ
jgi:hypothetical protein